MGNIKVFIDFGSTFTKMVAIDLDGEELVGRVQVPSTVDTDINIGLDDAFSMLDQQVGIGESERASAVACSSAAGGLRVICVGLVRDFTTEAARMAALGAGAKIVGTYSYELSSTEIAEIEEIAPDIVLLTGGTEGGNKKVISHNAKCLASAGKGVSHVIVAGNKAAYGDIADIFCNSGKNVIYTNNVMPEIGTVDVVPANRNIRDLFIKRITEAKGISRVKARINDVIMPTPSAVLAAAVLMADGLPESPGFGELILVDVGGATTDVYSIAQGIPTKSGVTMVGLPEPYAKRTVEGDLGLVFNLDRLNEIGMTECVPFEIDKGALKVHDIGRIPKGSEEESHVWLSYLAVKTAVERHVGRIEVKMYPNGDMFTQKGKDLSHVKRVVGAGGPVVFSQNPRQVLAGSIQQDTSPSLLKPKTAEFMLDRSYIMFALGLLAQSEPAKALSLMKKYIVSA